MASLCLGLHETLINASANLIVAARERELRVPLRRRPIDELIRCMCAASFKASLSTLRCNASGRPRVKYGRNEVKGGRRQRVR